MVQEDTMKGIERLACALRYANPLWSEGRQPAAYNTDPLREVTKSFDRDLKAPPVPTSKYKHQ